MIEIIDLSNDTKMEYFTCLEEWSNEVKDGVCRKECWHSAMEKKSLRVKLARNEKGIITGMIHYAPIEYSWIEGENLYFVYCVWVHGHKKGRGDYRKQGIGKELLLAAEEDVRKLGSDGLVVWGLLLPFFMRAGWFRKNGYKKVDRKGISVLLWKTFANSAVPPRWMRTKKKPERIPGKVVVTALANGWCSGINGMVERAKNVCSELGEKVIFQEVKTTNRETIRLWGSSDGLFIDGRNVYKGPPLTYDQLRKLISRRLKRL